jgi:hypothetical protein
MARVQSALSDAEIRQLRQEVAAGRTPTVWFTESAVGVDAGRSGKVITVGDESESDFLQVRPTGSSDVLSFSPNEVTVTRPQRSRAASEKPAAKPTPAAAPVPAPIAPTPAKPTAAVVSQPGQSTSVELKPAPRAETAAPKPAARKAKTVEVTVTLTGTADGDWTVDVVSGKRRSVRAVPVPGAAVAQAAKYLPAEVSEAVDSVVEAAKSAQRVRVEQLQAELAQAQRMLNDLD